MGCWNRAAGRKALIYLLSNRQPGIAPGAPIPGNAGRFPLKRKTPSDRQITEGLFAFKAPTIAVESLRAMFTKKLVARSFAKPPRSRGA